MVACEYGSKNGGGDTLRTHNVSGWCSRENTGLEKTIELTEVSRNQRRISQIPGSGQDKGKRLRVRRKDVEGLSCCCRGRGGGCGT